MPRRTGIPIIVCGVFLEPSETYTHMPFFLLFFSDSVVFFDCRHQSYILLLLLKIENKQKIINIDKYFLFFSSFSLLPGSNRRVYTFPSPGFSVSLSHPFFFSSIIDVVTVVSVLYVCVRFFKRKMTFALSPPRRSLPIQCYRLSSSAASLTIARVCEGGEREKQEKKDIRVFLLLYMFSLSSASFCNKERDKNKYDEICQRI